jgi:hypothetical protein
VMKRARKYEWEEMTRKMNNNSWEEDEKDKQQFTKRKWKWWITIHEKKGWKGQITIHGRGDEEEE